MKNHQDTNYKRTFSVWIKTVACILSLLLALYAVPTNVFAELVDAIDTALDSSDEQSTMVEAESVNESGVFEVIDRREETVKHFRTEDGSFTAVQYNVPVHEKDENGAWQDIDNTLSESGSEYATSNARVKFAKKTTGNETLFTLHDGNRKITMSLSGANKKVEGQVTNTRTEFAEDATQLQKLMTLDKLSSKILYPDILDGVDLEYVVNSCNIKENIIVKDRADAYSYTFEIQLNNLEAVLCEDGSVVITDPDKDEVVYTIPKGYMFDADGEYSDAVQYALTDGGNKKYTLTVTADAEWINAEGRAFPVTVDPPISGVSNNANIVDTYIDSDNPSSPYSGFLFLASGTGGGGQEFISYWKTNSLPIIPTNSYIVSAQFSLYCQDYRDHSGYSSAVKIGAYQVTSSWDTNITWTKHTSNNVGAFSSATLIDYADVNGESENQYVSWDITRLYRMWHEGTTNNGIALAQLDNRGVDALFSSSETSNIPRLIINYRDMKGVESYWSGSSHSAGLAGNGYVNHAGGNLVFAIVTLATGDSLFGYAPQLVYNSSVAQQYNTHGDNDNVPYKVKSVGYGMKLSTNETIVEKTFSDESGNNVTYYIWADGDGTEHYFLPDSSADTSEGPVYKDEDGLLLTLKEGEDGYVMTDAGGNTRHFKEYASSERMYEGYVLDYIQDVYGNQLQFSLNDYCQTTAISVRPNGHDTPVEYLTFTYNSLFALTEIRNAFTQQVVSLLYAASYGENAPVGAEYDGPLSQVKYGHLSGTTPVYDATVSYTYTTAIGPTFGNVYRLATATDDLSGTSIRYAYDVFGRVSKVTEYGGDTEGQSISYTYGQDYVELRSSGSDDILQTGTDSDDIITHYSLDYCGRAVSVYSTNAARTAMYGASNSDFGDGTDDAPPNSLKTASVTNSVSVNHIYNGGFEISAQSESSDVKDAIYGWSTSSVNVGIGCNYLQSMGKMLLVSVDAGESESIQQDVTLPVATYTLSTNIWTNTNGTKITLRAVSGTITLGEKSYALCSTTGAGASLSPTLEFTVETAGTVRIQLIVEGGGSTANTVYIDNVMLANNIGAGSFNALEFGGFEDTYAYPDAVLSAAGCWDASLAEGSVIGADGGLFGECLYLEGDVNGEQKVGQRVTVTTQSLVDMLNTSLPTITPIHFQQSRIFTVSGFAKGVAPIANKEARYCLAVDVYYEDGTYDPLQYDFNRELDDWQFIGGTFATKPGQIVRYIDVYCVYAYQSGSVRFDNISLVEETGSEAANYYYRDDGLPELVHTPSYSTYYEYDDSQNLIYTYDTEGNGRYCTYDGKVLLSETTFQYDEGTYKLLDWYHNSDPDAAWPPVCTPISKTEYNINAYGLNTSTITYAATGEVKTATQAQDTPKLMSNTVYILTEGSPLFGRVSSATDAARVTTFYAYNDKGQLLYEHNTSTEGLYYTYDSLGRTVGVFPLAHGFEGTTVYYYSAVGEESAQYTYDPDTRLLTEIQTATTTYTFEYDCFGNRTAVKAGNNTLAQYIYNDRNGKLKEVRYGTGKTVTYVYDELDRVKEMCYNDSDGAAQKYIYAYTTSGAVHSVESTECGRRYDYDYDSKGQLIGYTECEQNAEGIYIPLIRHSLTYDEQDRIYQWHGMFDYTASNGQTYGDSITYDYAYEDYGKNDENGVTNVGELKQLVITGDNQNTLTYGYDSFYRLAGKTLAVADRFTLTAAYTYGGNAYISSTQVKQYTSTVTVGGTETATAWQYEYDNDGSITKITDSDGKVTRYEYDDLGQLIREDNPYFNATYVYDYDDGGNRMARIVYAYTTEDALGDIVSSDVYGYQEGSGWGDRSSVNVYDGQGNPLYFDSYSLTWDGRRLVEMNRSSGQSVISFQYNQDGIRTSKTVDGVKHTYLLSGSQIVGETWGNNLLIYLYDESGSPIGMQYRNTNYDSYDFDTFYFEKNLQGDIVAVYNEDGEKVLGYTYDAWGNHTLNWYSIIGNDLLARYNPFRYRGYYYDTETKLYYLQSRYYDPYAGRFLNADSVIAGVGSYIQGNNMFTYCFNNPVNMFDVSGHWPQWIKDAANWVNNNVIQPVAHFFSPSTNTISGQFQEGIFKGSGSLTGGYSEFNGRLQINSKDNKNNGMLGGFGKVSVGNASGKIGIGNDNAALSLKGVADGLTANAQAGIQYKDGAGLAVKGKAAVVSGRITAEVELFDWQIEFGVSGDLLSVGAEAMIGVFPDEGFAVKANAGAGVFGFGFLFRVKPSQ